MSDPNRVSSTPPEDGRARLARLAAEAAARQAEVVGAASDHFRDVEQAALDGLARIAEEVRELPPQNKDTLGPLWPGNQ